MLKKFFRSHRIIFLTINEGFTASIYKFPNAKVELDVKTTLTNSLSMIANYSWNFRWWWLAWKALMWKCLWLADGQWNGGVDTNRRSNRLLSSMAHSTSFLSLALRTRHSADFPGSIGLPKFWLQSSAKKNQRQLIHVKIAFIFLFIFIVVVVFPPDSRHKLVIFGRIVRYVIGGLFDQGHSPTWIRIVVNLQIRIFSSSPLTLWKTHLDNTFTFS